MDEKEVLSWIRRARLENWDGLDLSNNHISTLPPEIGQLKTLSVLDLSQTGLVELPGEITSLTNLRVLKLRKNQLSSLPSGVGQLANLMRIDIAENSFQDFPLELCDLKKLVYLDVSQNKITYIPKEIHGLVNLEFLDLSGNGLIALPPEMGQLRSLKELSIHGSALSDLPIEVMRLTHLRKLDLRDGNLPIPPEILARTDASETILNFYAYVQENVPDRVAARISPEFKYLNELKLILVGQGSVGKTSLVQQILHGTFDQHQSKTEGISINQWQVETNGHRGQVTSSNSRVRLNIWDFGGQEIMHATHQFFLTKRSLYLLVIDARLTQEENRVEYWLKIIQSFGGESPVLIIGNKTDQHPLDIDRTGLQKKYPNIAGILETSAATGAGIDALKAEIAKQVDHLPHVRDLLPEAWFTVKSKLEDLAKNKNFFTQDEYLGLCATNNITDETSQHTLIGFLHDLGVVLHFQDDPRLEQLGILNPQWVTNGVYKVLNSHDLFQNQGTLTLPLLNKILNLPEYPSNKRLFIVDMMKKFELCYDIEPDKSFLIPDLLPKDEPFMGDWNIALAFQYHYNVLPTSIISRFIVRMNAFVHKTIWRSGVILKNDGNTALVKADTEDRKIYVWVGGNKNTRRDFLSAIRTEFEAIHKTIAKIEATEEVPHPNYPDLILDYSELIEFERQGVTEFPKKVGNQVIMCNVRELLDGVRPSQNQATKVFISYAHQDKTFVKKLANRLESQGMKVWWDFDTLKGGQDWQKEIERGIKQCDFFLVALTPDAVTSEWVGNEIAYANNAQKTIIPLRLKKCDIPIVLIKKQFIDVEGQTQKATIKELLELLKDKT